MGVDWTGVDLSIAVTYIFERVLKDVGELVLTLGKAFAVLTLGPGEDFVCKDNLGLLEDSAPAMVTIVPRTSYMKFQPSNTLRYIGRG